MPFVSENLEILCPAKNGRTHSDKRRQPQIIRTFWRERLHLEETF